LLSAFLRNTTAKYIIADSLAGIPWWLLKIHDLVKH
jgi:hypothetical protein